MPLDHSRIVEITDRIGQAKVMILGDIMLDEYWHGAVTRISPEAPVPVVEVHSMRHLLGGAANVAANVSTLGDTPVLVGIVGDDDSAGRFRELLTERQIDDSSLVVDKSRPTTIKTRIIAHNQQVVRADREIRDDLSAEVETMVLERVISQLDDVSALILSDYGKGVITLSLLERLIDECNKRNVFLAVDPKETRFHNYVHVSLITPNHHEAGFAGGRKITNEEDLLAVGNGLLERLQAKNILITRGPEGMSLFRQGEPPTHIPTFARKVYDVTGAGDTVIATYVSAIAAGASEIEAAIVSNAAAGVTVAEIGTATVTVAGLREALERTLKDGHQVRNG